MELMSDELGFAQTWLPFRNMFAWVQYMAVSKSYKNIVGNRSSETPQTTAGISYFGAKIEKLKNSFYRPKTYSYSRKKHFAIAIGYL